VDSVSRLVDIAETASKEEKYTFFISDVIFFGLNYLQSSKGKLSNLTQKPTCG